MKASFIDRYGKDSGQLGEIASLIDAGTLRPVLDRVFPFASTAEALAYVESGRVIALNRAAPAVPPVAPLPICAWGYG